MSTKGQVSPILIALIIIVTVLGAGTYLFLTQNFSSGQVALVVFVTITFMLLLWRILIRYLNQ